MQPILEFADKQLSFIQPENVLIAERPTSRDDASSAAGHHRRPVRLLVVPSGHQSAVPRLVRQPAVERETEAGPAAARRLDAQEADADRGACRRQLARVERVASRPNGHVLLLPLAAASTWNRVHEAPIACL